MSRLGGAPAVFNINEPIIFGTPVVMNPLLLLPFFLTPMLTGTLLYSDGCWNSPGCSQPFSPLDHAACDLRPHYRWMAARIFRALIIVMSVSHVFARRVDLRLRR